ncbi:3-methyl-2-oxobutanoate hydroxymethyltransferase [Thalassobacillus devorans]|uniref:3-methyl-2-oxobutanoate hydroxymethyltransferase n=1 Tax=Thalassobacillus devorans TaxID=279813 RepID=A0ABQ1NYA4_9BACI|nr:3-methyl-2-oxobutanoate hydroxymethyltransferase [Thalassobacillus devorans]NIK28282.1 3-methyl-2-oxobutanoate hydroxymethyltransferase [Thalassobacillus devorans]GGC87474.1 3-methyl-2-oxobutanoate hydroxymethyltransferase [Thalassobacillus devorans]
MLTRKQMLDMKNSKEKIAMVTAYDYPSAKFAENAGVDMILVGDSLGMVVLGYDSTIPVTVDDMIHHGKAVVRGAGKTYVVVDMPFMSYHISLEESLKNAMKIYQETQAQALKVEGAGNVLPTIERLTEGGIPVVGHLGLTPQSVNVLGGYKVQGKQKEAAAQLLEDSLAVERSGAIALVLECVPKELAALISEQLSIPTIGIGAGAGCDGQVLVYHDILNYGVDRLPKFVQTYGDANQQFTEALGNYVKEVKAHNFPAEAHTFTMDPTYLPSVNGDEK